MAFPVLLFCVLVRSLRFMGCEYWQLYCNYPIGIKLLWQLFSVRNRGHGTRSTVGITSRITTSRPTSGGTTWSSSASTGRSSSPCQSTTNAKYVTQSTCHTPVTGRVTSVFEQDFLENLIHHAATITLMTFSWANNMVRVGTLVLVIHDAVDYWLEVSLPVTYSLHPDISPHVYPVGWQNGEVRPPAPPVRRAIRHLYCHLVPHAHRALSSQVSHSRFCRLLMISTRVLH